MIIPKKYILELSTINNPKITEKLVNTNSYFAMYLLLESLNKKSYSGVIYYKINLFLLKSKIN